MIRRMVLFAAFAYIVPCLATAGTVSFTTTGTFSNPGLFPITFTGESYTNVNADPPLGNNLLFGTFTLSPTFTPITCKTTASETFTLHIDQTSPSPGSGNLDATLSGTVTKKGSHLTLTFVAASLTIGKISYSIPFPSETINFKTTTTLNGTVLNPVAEPSARLLLGLGALSLMGLTLAQRKMINI